MKTNSVRQSIGQETPARTNGGVSNAQTPSKRFGPTAERHAGGRSLRMYTEEEVSEMLQVSLSQLRKWRMKDKRDSTQGPPFKKIGRLVRYSEEGLLEYINSR